MVLEDWKYFFTESECACTVAPALVVQEFFLTEKISARHAASWMHFDEHFVYLLVTAAVKEACRLLSFIM